MKAFGCWSMFGPTRSFTPESRPMSPKSLLLQPSLHVLLAMGLGMLLGWPVISISGDQGHWVLYLYVFSVWVLMVALLAFIGRAIATSTPDDAPTSEPPGR